MLDFSEAKHLLEQSREHLLTKKQNPLEWAASLALTSAIEDLDKRLKLIENNQMVIMQMLRKLI